MRSTLIASYCAYDWLVIVMGFHTHEIVQVETEGKFRGKSDDKFLNNRLHFYMTNTVSMNQFYIRLTVLPC